MSLRETINEEWLLATKRDLISAHKRKKDLEELVRDMFEAVRPGLCDPDAAYLDGMCQLCVADNGGEPPCEHTKENLSNSHCNPYTAKYFKQRMSALGIEVEDYEQ